MSQVDVSFDTITKVLVVKLDGAVLPNVTDINIMASYSPNEDGDMTGMVEIRSFENDEENKCGTITKIHANKVDTHTDKQQTQEEMVKAFSRCIK